MKTHNNQPQFQYKNKVSILTKALLIIGVISLVACGQETENKDSEQGEKHQTATPKTTVAETDKEGIATDSEEKVGKEHLVLMVNQNEQGEHMVFEPAYLKVNVGDTVVFEGRNPGHSLSSRLVPEGADQFEGLGVAPIKVKIEKEGVYLYACPPHEAMSMVGVIQAGEATNLDAVKKALPELEAKTYTNKGRWEQYTGLIE